MLAEKRKRQNLVYIEATTNEPSLRLGDVGKISAWIPEYKIFKSGKIPIESYKVNEIIHCFVEGEGYTNTFIGVPKDLITPPVGDVGKISAWIPEYKIFKSGKIPIESYKVNEIIHCFVEGEGYTNTFIGVPKDLITPPDYDGSNSPVADIQHAIVTDNKDPKKMGRVRLQFVWQKAENSQTPWVQVIQPHAGTDKGTYINPEIGETVLVAFQGGNAEAPIVLGTAYNGEEISEYFTPNNDLKAIRTRSTTKIVFNDAEGSLLNEDAAGSYIKLEGDGNVSIYAVKNLNINVGENMSVTVGNNKTEMITNNYIFSSKSSSYSIEKDKAEMIGNYYYQESGSASIQTLKGSLQMRGTTLAVLQGGDDVKVSKG